MTRFRVWVRIVLFFVTVGLLIVGLLGQQASWAVAGQDIERQTVPTRTPTGQPVTPTVPPSPTVPPAATNTSESSVTPTSTGVATAAVTVTAVPVTLPEAGSELAVWNAGLILLLGGAWLVWMSRRVHRRE